MKNLTREESSLILYLESRATDYCGKVDSSRMNRNDFTIAEKWNDDGFVKFGRLKGDVVTKSASHWCCLSDEAWRVAHNERKMRANRGWEIVKKQASGYVE